MSYFNINTAVANVYKEASHNSAVVTQALMGESCRILDYWDEWYLMRQWDGYEGWIYNFYGVESKTKYEPTLILQDMFGTVINHNKEKMVRNLVFGSQLVAEEKHDGYRIILPDERKGFSHNNFGEIRRLTNREEIIKTASRFLGTPYVWGGKTPYGIDCSGLVQTVFKSVGIDLPRDAYQQAKFFTNNKIDEDKIETGDLLFFCENDKVTHVAISTGGLDFINARGFVQEESIDEKNPEFNRNLRNLFFHAVSIENMINIS